MALTVRQSYLLGTTPEPARTVAPAILRRTVMTSQPQYAAGIDWSNPLVVTGRIFAVVDASNGVIYRKSGIERMVPVSGGTKKSTQNGLAFAASGGTSDGWVSSYNFDDISGISKLSVFTSAKTSTTTGVLFGRWGSVANFGGLLATFDSGQIGGIVGSSVLLGVLTANANSGLIKYGFSWSQGNGLIPYLSGRSDVGSTWFSSAPSQIQTVGEKLWLCRHANSGSGSGNTEINLVVFGNAVWGPELHKSLSDNPWQIFLATNVTPWVSP